MDDGGCGDRDRRRGRADRRGEAAGRAAPKDGRASRYAGLIRSFNLRSVKLRSGEQYRDEIELELEPFELSDERYIPVPERVPAELAITKASTGSVFELRFTTRLHGPCFRCLEDAALELAIDTREYQATSKIGRASCRERV